MYHKIITIKNIGEAEVVDVINQSCVVVEQTLDDGSTIRFNAWSPNPGTYDEIWYVG